ncbi:hypothetical protein AB0B25_02300 [Nocardia sp. NPDC049190]|uniref:hypothetical protein n=1 Tax=Nocardia sp. NPDC049190 TaxID=3155650 RepID=UPI003409D2E6
MSRRADGMATCPGSASSARKPRQFGARPADERCVIGQSIDAVGSALLSRAE